MTPQLRHASGDCMDAEQHDLGAPDSRYASKEQCRFELRRATAMYVTHDLPIVEPWRPPSTRSPPWSSRPWPGIAAATSVEEGRPAHKYRTQGTGRWPRAVEDDNVRWFSDLGLGDLEVVGGQNA